MALQFNPAFPIQSKMSFTQFRNVLEGMEPKDETLLKDLDNIDRSTSGNGLLAVKDKVGSLVQLDGKQHNGNKTVLVNGLQLDVDPALIVSRLFLLEQDIPLPSSGDGEALVEMDKVYINVRGDHSSPAIILREQTIGEGTNNLTHYFVKFIQRVKFIANFCNHPLTVKPAVGTARAFRTRNTDAEPDEGVVIEKNRYLLLISASDGLYVPPQDDDTLPAVTNIPKILPTMLDTLTDSGIADTAKQAAFRSRIDAAQQQ